MQTVVIIEGVHLPRGAIATYCAKRAIKDCHIVALAWKSNWSRVEVSELMIADTVATYYKNFCELLAAHPSSLVIPCTQNGIIMANHNCSEHRLFAEPYLKTEESFNKIRLRERQNKIETFLIPSVRADQNESVKYPCLAKPIVGHSSQGHKIVSSFSDIESLGEPVNWTVEPILTSQAQHFSLSIVCVNGMRKWMCIERLEQRDGRTSLARPVDDPDVLKVASQIALNIQVECIFNVQFAWVHKQAMVYDLNPRFGFSEIYRANYGFNFVAEYLGVTDSSAVLQCALTEAEAFSLLGG